jgi:hypothetical protein
VGTGNSSNRLLGLCGAVFVVQGSLQKGACWVYTVCGSMECVAQRGVHQDRKCCIVFMGCCATAVLFLCCCTSLLGLVGAMSMPVLGVQERAVVVPHCAVLCTAPEPLLGNSR